MELQLSPERISEIKKREQKVLASKTFTRIAERFNFSEKRMLDIGCGFGEYMQRARQDSVGITTTPEEVAYGKMINRDLRLGNVEELEKIFSPDEHFDIFWGNNIFEHLLSPHAFLVNLKRFAGPDSMLILGTPMVPAIQVLMKHRRFRGALASPHINFFNKVTYRLTAQYAGWKILEVNPFFFSSDLLNKAASPIAPHLYLIAQNDQSYEYPQKKMNEWENDAKYQPLIEVMHAHRSN